MSQGDKGFSLIESMVSMLVLLVVTTGVLPLALVATRVTENQGHLMSRAAEYAQDKLEQLLSLSYGDATSDTRVFPATDTGGTGLTAGGSSDPNAPVALYVDYLDINGSLIASSGTTAPADWFYKRVWEVAVPSANLKQVTVTAIVRNASASGIGDVPRATVAALKSFPF
jgi:prepilin-type N-terminal cleavage/methylation domain-containing protein